MLGLKAGFVRRLLKWYEANRRDLPWRRARGSDRALDPYHVLVSEAMLQQTQVATVIPYYARFISRFPTIFDLANAQEQEVLRLWQGLGYYSRARNLQAAARAIARDHNGQVPRSTDDLLKLPGIGRYTAGAVASLAFEQRTPILDGNVQRVLCRLDKIEADPRDRQVQKQLWQRAEELLPHKRVGNFNSALMELGSLICTPRRPQCLMCPVRVHCQACAAGVQERIPPARQARPTPLVHRHTYCIRSDDRWLIEQRPARGRWAGMWQFITIDPEASNHSWLPKARARKHIGSISHALTHRRYRFEVFVCDLKNPPNGTDQPRTWTRLDEISAYPLPRPHLKIAQMLREIPR